MKTNAELGQEYLDTAEKILERLKAAQLETGPDYENIIDILQVVWYNNYRKEVESLWKIRA